jgi:hypothetical protein
MWAVSARYLQAVRTSHAIVSTAVHRDPFTGILTPLPIEDGQVVEDSTSAPRRVLTLTVPPTEGLWDVLSAPGGEITVTKAVRFIDGKLEVVPQGVFIVDQDAIDYRPDGTTQCTCPDRWLKVQRNRFSIARSSIPSNTVWQEIKRLVEGGFPNGTFPGWAQLDQSATGKVGPLIYDDGDRAAAAAKMASDHSLQVFFNREGKAVLRPTPVLTDNSTPVFTIDDGGVQVSASRTRDMSTVRNAVVVTSSATDIVLAPQVVENNNPDDRLSTAGPLGFVPAYYDSPLFRTTAQMYATGQTQLRLQLGVAQQLSLESAPNDALDADDVIQVNLPRIDRTTPRPIELHILDTVTTPLLAANTQAHQTRSTRPPSTTEGSS